MNNNEQTAQPEKEPVRIAHFYRPKMELYPLPEVPPNTGKPIFIFVCLFSAGAIITFYVLKALGLSTHYSSAVYYAAAVLIVLGLVEGWQFMRRQRRKDE